MADRTVKIITPATESDLLTLAELKVFLGINVADTSQDATLDALISVFSVTVAEICNRHPTPTFGEEEVLETWREIGNGRLFLSHWPVKANTVQSVSANGATLTADAYELEEASGKVSCIGINGAASSQWLSPVVVHYTGGYKLPEEAPLPLKKAVAALIREERIKMVQAQTAGIRQIRHKHAQVAFFDPNAILLKSVASGGKSPAEQQIENLLKHYIRIEV